MQKPYHCNASSLIHYKWSFRLIVFYSALEPNRLPCILYSKWTCMFIRESLCTSEILLLLRRLDRYPGAILKFFPLCGCSPCVMYLKFSRCRYNCWQEMLCTRLIAPPEGYVEQCPVPDIAAVSPCWVCWAEWGNVAFPEVQCCFRRETLMENDVSFVWNLVYIAILKTSP